MTVWSSFWKRLPSFSRWDIKWDIKKPSILQPFYFEPKQQFQSPMLYQSTWIIKNKKGFSPAGEKSTSSSPVLVPSPAMHYPEDALQVLITLLLHFNIFLGLYYLLFCRSFLISLRLYFQCRENMLHVITLVLEFLFCISRFGSMCFWNKILVL